MNPSLLKDLSSRISRLESAFSTETIHMINEKYAPEEETSLSLESSKEVGWDDVALLTLDLEGKVQSLTKAVSPQSASGDPERYASPLYQIHHILKDLGIN